MKELMESAIYRRILERGARKSKQEAILKVLEARFGEVDEEIHAGVQGIEDLSCLGELIVLAAKCTSLAEFCEAL